MIKQKTKTIFPVIYLIIIIFFSNSYLLSVSPDKKISEYQINEYTTDNGLPQISVLSITQTDDKYIWIATYNGLARFDGIHFKIFEKSIIKEMRNNSVTKLFNDSTGTLWIGTPNGLLKYKNNSFNIYLRKDGLAGDFIKVIKEDINGIIWIGTTKGLTKLENNKFRNFTTEDGLPHNFITTISSLKDGSSYIGTYNGMCVIKKDIIKPVTSLPTTRIKKILNGNKNTIWIGTGDSGLYSLQGKEIKNYGEKEGLKGNDIRALFIDSNGFLWVGTNKNGIYRYKNDHFSKLEKKSEILRNSIISIYEDHEGSIWIGTKNGLTVLKDDSFVYYNSSDGLLSNNIRSIFEDNRGTVWIGSTGGGLSRYQDGEFFNYKAEGLLNASRIWTIDQNIDDSIWVGTYGDGVKQLIDNKFVSYTTETGLSNNVIRVVHSDSKGRIWIGTNGGGIDVLSADGKILDHFDKNNGLSDDFIYTINEDSKDNIWVGTYSGGLNKISDKNITVFGPENGLNESAIWTIHVEKDPKNKDDLWIGTNGTGLHLMKNGKFHNVTKKDGLYNDLAFTIIEDLEGFFWMNCNKGIYRIKKDMLYDFVNKKIKSVSCISYGLHTGVKNTESSGPAQPVGFLSKNNELWFAGANGIQVIDSKNKITNKIAPNVIIESALVNDHFYQNPDIISVAPGKGSLKIDYTALSFIKPSKVFFKYKLIGYDENWQDVGTRRTAYYTNLSPGDYQFQVRACNNDGIWNKSGRSVNIKILPHYYQTLYFKLLVLILLIILIYLYFFFKLKRLKRSELRLKNKVDIRTSELKEKNDTLNYEIAQRIKTEEEKEKLIKELKYALNNISTLRGLLPICANCKKIRDDSGYWQQVEVYVREHTEASFSHSICPDCVQTLYPELKKSNK